MKKICKKTKNETDEYAAPDIQVIEVDVEKGFALSDIGVEDDEGGF